MPRAERTFKKAGLDIKGFPCAYAITPLEAFAVEDYIIPSAGAIRNWSIYLREVTGMLAYKLLGRG